METIYQSKFSKHEYDSTTKIIFTDWFKETTNMTTDDFKNEMQEWLNAFRKCKPLYLYDRCVDFNYTITPDEQIWMANLLNAEWIKLGLKKYAHIVPAEMITELSVEQLFDEFFQMKLENQYPIIDFADREKALEWLMENDEIKN